MKIKEIVSDLNTFLKPSVFLHKETFFVSNKKRNRKVLYKMRTCEYLKIDNNWDFMCTCPREYHRYLIIDDYGNVRDFHQLTKKYKKKYYRTYHKHHGWNIHWASTVPDQRKSITPEEIVEVRNEYGITLKPIKPKRKTDSWDHVRGLKVSGWKMQSKRRKQWKPMEGI